MHTAPTRGDAPAMIATAPRRRRRGSSSKRAATTGLLPEGRGCLSGAAGGASLIGPIADRAALRRPVVPARRERGRSRGGNGRKPDRAVGELAVEPGSEGVDRWGPVACGEAARVTCLSQAGRQARGRRWYAVGRVDEVPVRAIGLPRKPAASILGRGVVLIEPGADLRAIGQLDDLAADLLD